MGFKILLTKQQLSHPTAETMTYANTTPVIPGSKVITLVYSTTKKNHDIKLNVVIPPVLLDSNGEAASHPLLIAWHGGGLVNGSRLDQYISEPLLGKSKPSLNHETV